MKGIIKGYTKKMIDHLANRIANKIIDNRSLSNNVAYRMVTETMFKDLSQDLSKTNAYKLFSGISDDFWIWLFTDGYRSHPLLRSVLPGMPSEEIQLNFTGDSGDATLRDGFKSYTTFKELYEKHVGPIKNCNSMLDYGCGWGRITRFFIKDIEPTKIWGCDPVEEMITICKEQNKWCNFERINYSPPTSFQNDTFEFIFSYSIFSHLSEERHRQCLAELHRILKPGGLLLITTRNRDFIEACAKLRKRKDLNTLNNGPKSSAGAFLDTKQVEKDYDNGKYCFTQLGDGDWSYWGDTAIPKRYVLNNWTNLFTFLDYIDDTNRCEQNVIVVQKPFN